MGSYTDIVITTDDGKKTTVDTGGWKPFYKQDDYFLFYDMEGEIRPYYYYIFSVDIDEQLFDQASDCIQRFGLSKNELLTRPCKQMLHLDSKGVSTIRSREGVTDFTL